MKLEIYQASKDILNGKQAHEKALNVVSLLGNANQNYSEKP